MTAIRSYLNLINQRMKRVLEVRLLPYDITPQQARIVGFVGARREQGQTVYQKDIEVAFELTGPSVTSLVQGLERKGFIVRQPNLDDERRKDVGLLPKGQALISEFEDAFEEIEAKMLNGLSLEQRQILEQTLQLINHNLEH